MFIPCQKVQYTFLKINQLQYGSYISLPLPLRMLDIIIPPRFSINILVMDDTRNREKKSFKYSTPLNRE